MSCAYLSFQHYKIAYHHTAGRHPGVLWFGGFRSDMSGTKATYLEDYCRKSGYAYTRFDYRGHGQSDGCFEDLTLTDWLEDGLHILDQITQGPQIIVGSSMGGWLALRAALLRKDRVKGLILLAPAPDFTRDIWHTFDADTQKIIQTTGVLHVPSAYGAPYPLTLKLFEDGEKHILLDQPIALDCPVTLIHGQADPDVPWQKSLTIKEKLLSKNVDLHFIPDGDHRLSRPEDLALIAQALEKQLIA